MPIDVLGFTGTRKGMTVDQMITFHDLLYSYKPYWFVHGDCVGADKEAHGLVRDHSFAKIEILPCDLNGMRAYCQGDKVHPERPPLMRNQRIIDISDRIIACPYESQPQLRGGTWWTIRRAAMCGVPCVIIAPDGTIQDYAGR